MLTDCLDQVQKRASFHLSQSPATSSPEPPSPFYCPGKLSPSVTSLEQQDTPWRLPVRSPYFYHPLMSYLTWSSRTGDLWSGSVWLQQSANAKSQLQGSSTNTRDSESWVTPHFLSTGTYRSLLKFSSGHSPPNPQSHTTPFWICIAQFVTQCLFSLQVFLSNVARLLAIRSAE